MDKITIFEVTDLNDVATEWVKIDRGNGEYTSMLKSTYETMQAEQSTPLGVE
jgi:hypothetical protein